MRMFGNSILVMLIAASLLAMISPGLAQVEMRPAEKAAQNLFDKGIGDPWVGGEPFSSNAGLGDNQMRGAASLYSNYKIIGYLDVTAGLIVASDSGVSLHFKPGPGSYPVYGCFTGNRMTGVFVDFNTSPMSI
jgi:hypothetical protein